MIKGDGTYVREFKVKRFEFEMEDIIDYY